MLNPIITPPRVPLVDANTGLINRAWYLFFVSLNNIANDVVNDPSVGPSPESLIASYDALIQTLTQEVETQPSTSELVAQTAELQKQVDALQSQIGCPCAELTAELQKQLDALQSAPIRNNVELSQDVNGILPLNNLPASIRSNQVLTWLSM
jgi:hypothetical protein